MSVMCFRRGGRSGGFVDTCSRWGCEEGSALRGEGLACHYTGDSGALDVC